MIVVVEVMMKIIVILLHIINIFITNDNRICSEVTWRYRNFFCWELHFMVQTVHHKKKVEIKHCKKEHLV